MRTQLLAAGPGFEAPGPADFEFPPLFTVAGFEFTKPMLIVVLGTIAVAAFFYVAARNPKLIPGKLQFAGEAAYGFIRNSVVLDAIGAKNGKKFVPYIATLFFFIAALNISGIIPILQFPATSKIAIPAFLAVISWVIYNAVGIRRQGFVGYFKNMMFPPGLPWPIYILLAPLEFFSTFVIRPFTLALRLAMNMFAGHLVLLLCILGGEYMLTEGTGALPFLSWVGFLGGIVLTFFEGFIQILQAYVFALLSAIYIAGAMEAEH
ncbi:F0F1 ATP synthase subunit A [Cryptosporangium minutisporangium]|uniref:ATP synthase subunit a n=1 Tax=Cryptosporangium minutisporangium TaxID=113569 RepID=A0ABP6T2C2_9ACTN